MTPRLRWSLVGLVLLLAGCKESTLGPELFGTIDGRVIDFDTGAALGGVSVTTSPATDAVVTGADGAFRIEDAPSGAYTITARRTGYRTGSAAIAVQQNRVTQATVVLQVDDGGTDTTATRLDVEVTNFFNRVRPTSNGDSVTVVVEYRVRNTGTTPIPSYEAYFRIVTPSGDFLQEVQGTAIGVGQTDIGRFEKETGGARATEVRVDGFFIGGQARPVLLRGR